MRHLRELGASEITAFLSWLAVKKNVAPSTQNQALSAVLFLYRAVLHQDLGQVEHVPHAKVAARMPVVLSADEVRRVLKQLSGVSWIIVSLLYGAAGSASAVRWIAFEQFLDSEAIAAIGSDAGLGVPANWLIPNGFHFLAEQCVAYSLRPLAAIAALRQPNVSGVSRYLRC